MKRPSPPLVLLSLILLIWAAPAQAATITIDGSFTDWSGVVGRIDKGGADDQPNPARADITEYRAAANSTTLYLLMAWDDTAFNGGSASTAGITVKSGSGVYYRVYMTADGNPGSVASTSLQINRCSDATCNSQSPICTGSACTGAQSASSTNWIDPFAGRSSPDCTGTNCGSRDTAVELALPWSLIGGAPQAGQYVFLQYNSYPSGPSQAPKDDVPGPGNGGVSCGIVNGSLNCYPSTPTAVDLISFTITPLTDAMRIDWATASEYTSLGFRLYRSTDNQRDHAALITPMLVPATGDGATGASYTWTDSDVTPDVQYSYWLQEVETTGTTTEYGPVSATICSAADGSHVFLPLVVR